MLLIASEIGGYADVCAFRNGKVLLPVVIAHDASRDERAAANDLARVLGLMSGLNWPVLTEGASDTVGFYVGGTTMPRQCSGLKVASDPINAAQGEIGPDAFWLFSARGSIVIESATPAATRYAVAWLLQHYGGVRWFSPGTKGEVVPRRAEWTLPELHEVHEPVYLSREISGLEGRQGEEWAVRNGLGKRFDYNHALGRVFMPEVLDMHREWCPLLSGERYRPESAEDSRWQPNLALPEVSEYAAKAATAVFGRDPQQLCFSLGINDTVRFDQSKETQKLIEPLRYFRGRPDYSPLVFSFMNRAAKAMGGVESEHYLGCLAYFWCENVPPFPVARRVIPYVATDRSQYYDSSYCAEDLELMTRWSRSGVGTYGLFEYSQGKGFLIPREPYHALFKAVREGACRGARGYMADAEPQWGFDEFKNWALARLLWEPNLTYEELADDFFPRYYGQAAASMRHFFERCEAQWMRQAGDPYWLKYYQQEDQALLFPPEVCHELHKLLETALSSAQTTPEIGDRIERTLKAFSVTEAFVAYDRLRRKLLNLGDDPVDQKKLEELADLIRECIEAKNRLVVAYDRACIGAQPAMAGGQLIYFIRNDPLPYVLWLVGQQNSEWPHRLLRYAGVESGTLMALARYIAGQGGMSGENLVENPNFAELTGKYQEPRFLYPNSGRLPVGWAMRAVPTEKGRVVINRANGTQSGGMRIEGAWDTQIYQWRPALPGRLYIGRAWLRGFSSPGCDSGVFLSFLSAQGKFVGEHRMQTLPKGKTDDGRVAVVAGIAPSETAWVGIGVGVSRQVRNDWFEVGSVSLVSTDVALLRNE